MNKKEADNVSGSSSASASAVSSKDDIIAKKNALESIIKKIDYHLNKNSVSDVDLYYLIKEFFREFLNLKYEFSLDELVSELDKIYLDAEQRERTFKFINKVKIIEYHDSSFAEDKIREFIVEFSAIAKLLIKNTQYENKSFWDKLTSPFRKQQKKEEVDYYKHTHSNEQVDVPIPVPQDLGIEELNKSLDSLTENEFSSADEKLEDSTPEELSQYKLDSKAKKKKDEKQTKIIQKEELKIQNPAKHYDVPVYRKSYALPDRKDEDKTIEDNSWDSEIDAMASERIKENNSNWAEPVDGDELSKNKNDEDINFDNLDTDETEDKKENKASQNKEDNGDEYNIENIAKNIEKEKIKLQKKTGKKNKQKTKEKQQTPSKKEKTAKSKITISKSPSVNKKRPQKEIKKNNPKNAELELLIEKAKKITKKEELMSVYKKINAKYDSCGIETQAKLYKSIMDIYKKISKLKK